jgi:hypothetical protein
MAQSVLLPSSEEMKLSVLKGGVSREGISFYIVPLAP